MPYRVTSETAEHGCRDIAWPCISRGLLALPPPLPDLSAVRGVKAKLTYYADRHARNSRRGNARDV
jgi:O-acetyl-ADP-ribose deacetylase (regulator of RNase III)